MILQQGRDSTEAKTKNSPWQRSSTLEATVTVAGVDGCRNGWVAVFRSLEDPPRHSRQFFGCFADLLASEQNPSIIAVDVPIGLPERAGKGGRGPESAVRPFLGKRKPSVFSIPSRAAVHAPDYVEACRVALETSDPPRKISRQGFAIFPKILEIDRLMTPALETRVYEVHPELAFWRLNGETAMSLPKKAKDGATSSGIEQRQALLECFGFDPAFWLHQRPRGVAADDLVDASVSAVIAERILRGEASPFPAKPSRDEKGLRMAIWA